MADLLVCCWECHKPLPEGGLQVWMKPDNPFSNSVTRLCEDCFEKRYQGGDS